MKRYWPTKRTTWVFALIVLGASLGSLDLLSPGAAHAQAVVAVVNGEPITSFDVDQRTRLLQAINRRTPSKKEALEELITEKIKVSQAKRLGVEPDESDINRAINNIAQQSGQGIAGFTAALKQAGIELQTFKAKVRADLSWQKVVEKALPGAFIVRDADVVAALAARGQQAQTKVTQYSLRQFIFVVPRGASAAERAARIKEAEGFRARFPGCAEGTELAREYRGLVVKDPVIRLSTDLPPKLEKLLSETRDGQMTPPEPIATGIEVVAVCGRKETIADVTSRRDVKEELRKQMLEAETKQLLERYRRQSIIEYR